MRKFNDKGQGRGYEFVFNIWLYNSSKQKETFITYFFCIIAHLKRLIPYHFHTNKIVISRLTSIQFLR